MVADWLTAIKSLEHRILAYTLYPGRIGSADPTQADDI